MIVSFSVSNFRSFNEEQTFSLIASNRIAETSPGHLTPIPGSPSSVLRTAVMYGANGAGKSNFVKALRYFRSLAIHIREKDTGTGRQPFQLRAGRGAPSEFDLQFIVKGRLYRYCVHVDDDGIRAEWLVHVEKEREKILYERLPEGKSGLSVRLVGLKSKDAPKLNALATVGGPRNCTFLATIRANLEPVDGGELLRDVIVWFETSLITIGPDQSLATICSDLSKSAELRAFSSQFLKSASTGITELVSEKTEITFDQLRSFLPSDHFRQSTEDKLKDLKGSMVFPLDEDTELFVERSKGVHYYRVQIFAGHGGKAKSGFSLPFREESDGTKRLLNLLPALHDVQKRDAVYVIDEIDRSMHPNLAWAFIDFFLRSSSSGSGQIIVTTHESRLLDQDLLRRDEVWFAEKDREGATKLYSLLDFKTRNDLQLRKNYLEGRFGAIPFLGGLRTLERKIGGDGAPKS